MMHLINFCGKRNADYIEHVPMDLLFNNLEISPLKI